MSEPRYPDGWDQKRIREVLEHYEPQTEDEQFEEIEASLEQDEMTLVSVPSKIMPEVLALIAREQKTRT